MIEPESHEQLRREIARRIAADRRLLDELRIEVRPLRNEVRRIQPRSTTSISLVGTDGGNNSLQFDPFLVQLIRVVDSANNEYCLEAITPTTNVDQLARAQFGPDGSPVTPLGEMMHDLGTTKLQNLSHMIRSNDSDRPTSPSWVQVYRELVEWATLYMLLKKKDFGTDTLIVFDGLLRSKVFAGDHFKRYLDLVKLAIEAHYRKNRRRIYLVGVAKHSKVLARYRLAMSLEQVMTTDYPAYLEVPRIHVSLSTRTQQFLGINCERCGKTLAMSLRMMRNSSSDLAASATGTRSPWISLSTLSSVHHGA